jgi:hypothetical protein
MMKPKPKIQVKSPSATGPIEPSSKPPTESFSSTYFRKVMMSFLSAGVRFASFYTGMFCGPVTMAS